LVGGGDGGLACELIEVVGQQYEIVAVDFAVVVEVAFVPAVGDGLV